MGPGIFRFAQPDATVPDQSNPHDLYRYSHVPNNPVRNTDPTGHCKGDADDPDNACYTILMVYMSILPDRPA